MYSYTVSQPWVANSEFHLVYVINRYPPMLCLNSLNKYYIVRIFVKEHTSVNFNSERKCCGVLDQMFLKDLTNVSTRSQSILSKLGKINQELTVENVHVVNHRVRETCLVE